MTILPDVLAPGLDVVFCGSAVGRKSAEAGAYYAGPGNKFWPALHEIGLTPRRFAPEEYPGVLAHGIGLTDMNKTESGGDHELSADADDAARLRRIIETFQPAFLAFTAKRPAKAFFGRLVDYGRQNEAIGATVVHVLPSTSGRAGAFWDIEPWRALARDVAHRRESGEAKRRLDPEAREDLRSALNRAHFHPLGLDLRKRRDDSEGASRMISGPQVARLREGVADTAAAFFERHADFLPQPGADELARLTAEFFDVYQRRAVRDNEGGTKFADSFWLFLAVRLLDPELIIESGTHRGHSSWIMRQACPNAEIHCFDVSFRNLVWRDPANHYHEHDWMEADVAAGDPARALCYFDDHISHAQRVQEAHGRGFRTLLFDDDFPAHKLHATGHPPAPTLAMIFDEDLTDGERIEWTRHGKPRAFVFDAAEAAAARALIAHYAKTPDIGPQLRLRPQSGLGIVRLRD